LSAMDDFVFEVDLVATVRVRATDENVAREVIPTVVKAPAADEIRLANENNVVIGPGRDATVTDVDFSIKVDRAPLGLSRTRAAWLTTDHSGPVWPSMHRQMNRGHWLV
jgi:hypothetical protein